MINPNTNSEHKFKYIKNHKQLTSNLEITNTHNLITMDFLPNLKLENLP